MIRTCAYKNIFHCMPLNYTDVLIPPAVPSNMVYIYTMYLEKVKWKIWGITLQHSVYRHTGIYLGHLSFIPKWRSLKWTKNNRFGCLLYKKQNNWNSVPCFWSNSSIFTNTSDLILANRTLASCLHLRTSLEKIQRLPLRK